jgi:threonine/homoserine/homoserine lactone efflux protein
MSYEFLVTSLVIVASPGTGALYTLATALSRGARASLVAAFGCTLGIIPHLAAAIGGLAVILHTSAVAFQALKWLGVAYLLFMAWSALRDGVTLKIEGQSRAASSRQVIVHAVLINILNPKLSIFFFAFLPQFVTADDPHSTDTMLILSGVFMAMTFVVFAIYGVCAASLRDRIITRPAVMAWMRRTFAAAFVLLGAKLALAER